MKWEPQPWRICSVWPASLNSSSGVCDSEIHLMSVNGHGTSGQPQANTSNPLPRPE